MVGKRTRNEPETNPRKRRDRKLLRDLNRAYNTPLKRAERRLLQEAKESAGMRLNSEW
jgi:hypothetical protein